LYNVAACWLYLKGSSADLNRGVTPWPSLQKRRKCKRSLCDKRLCATSSDVNAQEKPGLCLN